MDPWATPSSDPFASPPQQSHQYQQPPRQQQQQQQQQQQSSDPFAGYTYPTTATSTSSTTDPFTFPSSSYPSSYPSSSTTASQPTRGPAPPGIGQQHGYTPSSYAPTPYSYPTTTTAWPSAPPPQRVAPPPHQYQGGAFDAFGSSASSTSYNPYVPPSSAYPPPPQQPSYAQSAAFNPFDMAHEEPYYQTSAPPPPPAKPKVEQQQPPPAAYQPPTMEQQRLIRTASLLFEHGLVIKTDKTLLQDLVLAGHKKVGPALDSAERNRNTKSIDKLLVKARKREDEGMSLNFSSSSDEGDAEETDIYAGDTTMGGGNGDFYEGGEDFTRRDSTLVSSSSSKTGGDHDPPHPAAGGFNASLPSGMKIEKNCLTGHILMRISSKKMFRKWKPMFFALDKNQLMVYEDRRQWEFQSFPKATFMIHECSWIGRPSLKTSSSLIEGGFMEKARPVYCSWLKENPPNLVSSWSTGGMERPKAFSHALEERILAKFAAYDLVDVSAFAYAIFGVITAKQKSAAGGNKR